MVNWVVVADELPESYRQILEEMWRIDQTIWDSMHEGKVVYDDGFWKKAREEFDKVRKEYKLRKTGSGWRAYDPF